MRDLGYRRLKLQGCVPGAPTGAVEPVHLPRSEVCKRGVDKGGMRPAPGIGVGRGLLLPEAPACRTLDLRKIVGEVRRHKLPQHWIAQPRRRDEPYGAADGQGRDGEVHLELQAAPERVDMAADVQHSRDAILTHGLDRRSVHKQWPCVAEVKLVMATQPDQAEAHESARKYVRYGSSPRGAQALVECGRVLALLRGRFHLSIDDIKELAPSVLRHRIILNFDAHADGKTPDSILADIISGVKAAAA